MPRIRKDKMARSYAEPFWKIRELIQEEVDGKSHKSNVDTKQCTEN